MSVTKKGLSGILIRDIFFLSIRKATKSNGCEFMGYF